MGMRIFILGFFVDGGVGSGYEGALLGMMVNVFGWVRVCALGQFSLASCLDQRPMKVYPSKHIMRTRQWQHKL